MKITLGEGLTTATGTTLDVPDLLALLEQDIGMGEERWFCMAEFVGGHRRTDNHLLTFGIPVDLDFRAEGPDGRKEKISSDAWADELETAWETGRLPGTIFWRTPHGVRVLYVLLEGVADHEIIGRMADAVGAAAAKVVREIVTVNIEVDTSMRQPGRPLFMPRTKVKGEKRLGKVRGHRDPETHEPRLFTTDELLAMAPPVQTIPAPPPRIETPTTAEAYTELAAARLAFNERVGSEQLGIKGLGANFETESGWCPVCQHSDCFGPSKSGTNIVRGRWVCYSTNHWSDTPYADKGAKCGRKTRSGGATGDTLDLACFFSGTPQAQYLIHTGFLKPAEVPMPPSAPGVEQLKVPKNGSNFVSSQDFVRDVLRVAPAGAVYRWNGTISVLTRVDGRVSMRPLQPTGMALAANRWAEFFTERVVDGIAQPQRVNLDGGHGAMLLEAAQEESSIRELRGLIEYPAVGADGSILRAGWNEGSGIWYEAPQSLEGLEPAVGMTREEAGAWMRHLLEDYSEVFDDEARANAVGLICTAFLRPALAWHPVPLHAAISPMEGSGKSLLCETFVGEAVTGRPAANLHLWDNPDELAKSLFAYAQSGANCVVLDNVRGGTTIDDGGLASAITRPTFAGRVLGQSQMREMVNLFVPMLTGNNVSFSREMARRTVPIQFRPQRALQDRTFRHDGRAWVRQNRRRLAEVILGAIARAAKENQQGFPGRRYQGFEEWSRLVGGAVWQLGQDAWLAGLRDWHRSENSNPELAAMRGFCAAWAARGDLRSKPEGCRAADLWPLVEDDPTALGLQGTTDLRRRVSLGIKLTEMCDRVDLSPYRVTNAGNRDGIKRYRLHAPERQPGEDLD